MSTMVALALVFSNFWEGPPLPPPFPVGAENCHATVFEAKYFGAFCTKTACDALISNSTREGRGLQLSLDTHNFGSLCVRYRVGEGKPVLLVC